MNLTAVRKGLWIVLLVLLVLLAVAICIGIDFYTAYFSKIEKMAFSGKVIVFSFAGLFIYIYLATETELFSFLETRILPILQRLGEKVRSLR
ncbi:MAG: hypothetical protein GY793_02440 [Proteobacteria bacterium]|nr:hypothetical protein [Pseudomonadota bacterium]